LGFDAIATGHHARVVTQPDGTRRVARGVDAPKDQSYVLYMLGQGQLDATLLPVGHLTKATVRARAADLGLPTAVKPDSQDVCFITSTHGRAGFLRDRLPFTPGGVVDGETGLELGRVDAVELVTVGQRRGIGVAGGDGSPHYVTRVDVRTATVTVGTAADLLDDTVGLRDVVWSDRPFSGRVEVQGSAHGEVSAATFDATTSTLVWDTPRRRIAAGQAVVMYDADTVLGGGIAIS
ncbi:MAG TPA: tRNA methyl transferase PRC-barrel domain-containing protein, partial [Acidimicrobiales bacterium]|nr:tRNA methyl transferase PRC-barrel domain-containing protein [Acidimicrobiales bacterium]